MTPPPHLKIRETTLVCHYMRESAYSRSTFLLLLEKPNYKNSCSFLHHYEHEYKLYWVTRVSMKFCGYFLDRSALKNVSYLRFFNFHGRLQYTVHGWRE